MRSASAPVNGAEVADAYVRQPRNRPAAKVVPPSSWTRNGAVGSSWNAERNTVKVKPHITKKRGVNNRSDMGRRLGGGSGRAAAAMRPAQVYVVGLIADTHGLIRPAL